jgi:hypothetical protein
MTRQKMFLQNLNTFFLIGTSLCLTLGVMPAQAGIQTSYDLISERRDWIVPYQTPQVFSEGWFEKWQTLVAGILALVGGLITVIYLHKQIAQQQAVVEDEKKCKLITARLMMIATLVRISDYTEKAKNHYIEIVEMPDDLEAMLTDPDGYSNPYVFNDYLPDFLDGLFQPLIDVAIYSESLSTRTLIQEVMKEIQISCASMKKFDRKESRPMNFLEIAENFYALFFIQVFCAKAAKYARFQSEDIPMIKGSEIYTSMEFFFYQDGFNPYRRFEGLPARFKECLQVYKDIYNKDYP